MDAVPTLHVDLLPKDSHRSGNYPSAGVHDWRASGKRPEASVLDESQSGEGEKSRCLSGEYSLESGIDEETLEKRRDGQQS